MNCKFCEKEINNKGSLVSHEKRCKHNPNAIKFGVVSNFILYNSKVKSGEIIKEFTNQHTKAKKIGVEYKITEETRKKLSESGKRQKWDEERKIKHSESMKMAVSEHSESYTKNNVVGRVKNISYNGFTFKGKWEVEVAKWLDSKKIKWEHETIHFEYEWNGLRKYYPDFYLPEYNLYIEVKGFETERDRCKWKVVPNLIVIKKEELIKIRKNIFDIF